MERPLHTGRLSHRHRLPDTLFKFATLDSLRSFITRCQPEDTTLAGFDHSVRAWTRGSEYVHLTEKQYEKLAGRSAQKVLGN